MKQKWSEGKIIALIFGSLAGIFLLVLAFCVDIYRCFYTQERSEEITERFDWKSELKNETSEDFDWEKRLKDKTSETYDWKNELKKKAGEEKNSAGEEKTEEDEYWEGIEYYQFTDYIREDLPYQIELESLENRSSKTKLQMSYPVVSGEQVPNLDGINKALQNEITLLEEYMERLEKELSEDENYEFLVEGYVTYMSEKVLSVAYMEYGYLNSEFYESYVVSVNIDMTTGMVMDNTQILEIDDAFSIDFRERSDEQNGSIDELSVFSDQDITEYLNDKKYAIIFYTPLGMEVGMNYYGGWVTVTYPDFRDFLKQL